MRTTSQMRVNNWPGGKHETMLTTRIYGNMQSMLLEEDSRLLISFPENVGGGAPDPSVDLTANGHRMAVPFYLEPADWDLLPTSDDVQEVEYVDGRAGATFTLSRDGAAVTATLDVSMASVEDFEEETVTVRKLATRFSRARWDSRHPDSEQVRWTEYPDLEPGFYGHLGGTALWSAESCELILRDLGVQCSIPTVDVYVPGSTGEIMWSWREMVVTDGSVESVREVVRSHPGLAFELTITGTGFSDDYLQRDPPPLTGW